MRELLERARLTLREHGARELAFRIVTLPLRPTPLGRRLGYGSRFGSDVARARAWQRDHARPVRVITAAAADGSFAQQANRALRELPPGHDAVLLNGDVDMRRHWLALLQHEAYSRPDNGIVGAESRDRLGHRLPLPVLAVTAACMYLRRDVLDQVGLLDERYPGLADIDLCLRAWDAGWRVVRRPVTNAQPPEPERPADESQRAFSERWGPWFEERAVRTPEGRLRVVYVTEETGVGGGHRDVFEHLNRLRARGHDVELFTLGPPPTWFPLEAPVRTFGSYAELTKALADIDAIKVATWWRTAQAVWEASVRRGIPAYFVQDIETSYYPDDSGTRDEVLASYREEFNYLTISGWNRDRLRELSIEARLVPPGIDLDTFRPLEEAERRADVLLALGRSHPLKNLPLTLDAWRALPDPRPELWLFGIEPGLVEEPGARYFEAPGDAEVNRLLNEASVFVMTSRHEGFCLPALEAMAAGAAVVATDADGNLDFCHDGENCLMVASEPGAVAEALRKLLADGALRERLGQAGQATAADYAWERRIDELEAALEDIATDTSHAAMRVLPL